MGTLAGCRRILITGASRGIGRATAEALAKAGHRVVLAARSTEELAEAVRAITAEGGKAEALPMDVTSDESVTRAIGELLAGGPCDVLVNNAGICDQAEFLVQSAARREEEMALNYFGVLRVTRALLPAFVARGEGLIVNVSSLLGGVASASTANYSASKAALEAWSHALRDEVARFGVRVTVFVPGHTATACGAGCHFDGVASLPVAYTAGQLVRAIDRAPRVHVGSPVYWLLLLLARLFPAFMVARVGASARPLLRAERQAIADERPERRVEAYANSLG